MHLPSFSILDAVAPTSPLGVWYVRNVKDLRDSVEAAFVEVPESSRSGGGTVQNLPLSSAPTLGQEALSIAQCVSNALSVELDRPGLAKEHELGIHCVARLVERLDTPVHADNCGYTLLFTNDAIEVQDGNEWIELAPPEPEACFLLLGSHLSGSAPVHRVTKASRSRIVTIAINADDSTYYEEHWRQGFLSEAETLARDLHSHVPTEFEVQQHWKLVEAVVEGQGFRLPEIDNKAYWNLQVERYLSFLEIHRVYPDEAAVMLPPRQIHHVWLCHMLQPHAYQEDCQALLGRILPHSNESFDLIGCNRFHSLWKRHTGQAWPSSESLYHEVHCLGYLAKGAHLLSPLKANLWYGLDGLAEILDTVRREAPRLFLQDLFSTREDYARYLVAGSFAMTANPPAQLAPGCAIDLVWHAHQTNPLRYEATMRRLPAFLDHTPCGKLNPPELQWGTNTVDIWRHLFNRNVDLRGHSIGCCCCCGGFPVDNPPPVPRRPRGLQAQSVTGGEILVWRFEREHPVAHSTDLVDGGLGFGVPDFPVSEKDAIRILRLGGTSEYDRKYGHRQGSEKELVGLLKVLRRQLRAVDDPPAVRQNGERPDVVSSGIVEARKWELYEDAVQAIGKSFMDYHVRVSSVRRMKGPSATNYDIVNGQVQSVTWAGPAVVFSPTRINKSSLSAIAYRPAPKRRSKCVLM